MAARKPTTTTAAAAIEALAVERIELTFQDETYSVLPSSEWTLDIIEAFEEGRVAGFLKEVLGDDYAKLRATKPKPDTLSEFVSALTTAAGVKGN